MSGESVRKIDDGGGAFPKATIVGIHGEVVDVVTTGGMTLRDYFAAKAIAPVYDGAMSVKNEALGQLLESSGGDPIKFTEAFHKADAEWNRHIAEECYAIADAMIAARKTGGGA